MGSNPNQAYIDAAQSSINETYNDAMKVIKGMEKETTKLGKKAFDVKQDIKGTFGPEQEPASYYSRISENFGAMPSMPEQIKTYQTQLNQGDYPILGSPAHERFKTALVEAADMFDQYTQRGLNEIQPRFAAIQNDPAFNLQADERAMKIAQGGVNLKQIQNLTGQINRLA